MNRGLQFLFIILITTCFTQISAQEYTLVHTIPLEDKSFEVESFQQSKWIDLGFKGETPPDLHSRDTIMHDVKIHAYDGEKYLGMVTRDNDTWEQIGQLLSQPLQKGKKYLLKLAACYDPKFMSHMKISGKPLSYNTPIKVRVIGYDIDATSKIHKENLSIFSFFQTSELIDFTEWKEIEFILEPTFDTNLITIQAFYDVPVILPYNGNVMIDDISDILEIE